MNERELSAAVKAAAMVGETTNGLEPEQLTRAMVFAALSAAEMERGPELARLRIALEEAANTLERLGYPSPAKRARQYLGPKSSEHPKIPPGAKRRKRLTAVTQRDT